jgi:hypothetical protein
MHPFHPIPSPYSYPPRPSNLNQLPCRLIIRPQHRPTRPIRLDERQLQLGPQDPKLALRGIYVAEEGELGGVALAVGCAEVEVYEGGFEGDGCRGFVDLLEIEGGDY